MKLKYIVTVNYEKFEFENGTEALKFAEFAATNFKPGTYRDKIDVYMNLEVEPQGEPVTEAEDPNE